MSSQIAEGGCEAGAAPMFRSLSMDGVFIDTENGRADPIGVLASFAGSILVVEALDRSMAETFTAGKDTAGDALAVKFVKMLAEGLRGVAVFFDARERRDEGLTTSSALVSVRMDLEIGDPAEGIEMTGIPEVGTLAVDLQVPRLATLVRETFRSTARAGRAHAGKTTQVQD